MKYMMLIAGNEEFWSSRTDEENRELYGRVAEWWNGHEKAGRVIGGHELEPASTATTVRIAPDGRTTITDGPFTEGKEVVGGYGILEVENLDEALALASGWPAPDTLEIRPIVQRG